MSLRVGATSEGPIRFENIATPLKNREGRIVAGLETVRRAEEKEKALELLKQKTEEMERFHKLAIGREGKILELKERIKELEEQLKTTKPKS